MGERERSRSPSRRTSRVEQVVGRWLRRSRDSSSRERASGEVKLAGPTGPAITPIKLTVKIARNLHLDSHGFEVSTQLPLLVTEVIAGGPAEGRLLPGDQVLTINNVVTDDLTAEQAAEIIRESWDCVTLTVLRHSAYMQCFFTQGPKSSFMTAEKRARLKTNPVKVRFAEEVVVNGHSQGNSLLFLPNVLKVYLENGQTKAFKFEAKTTVKDIVLTLKEKLSIRCIEHFALVLEEQYSSTKLLLLHEEEFIQQVVHRKEAHNYRCLFRVCFLPREPLDLLQEDPVAFEYLYLQSVSDVLQERFAVEMKCNTALHLAALHIHERLDTCGHTQRASLKSITKDWGIENFISPTLLRNMSEKDLKKAIGYHMKKIQALLEPKQKVISATQARLSYLSQLGDLQSYGGKCFTATILLQDREAMVSLLVGARYGISQVINHKLNIISTLTEFSGITRVDLLPESERVSLVKIYLQDVRQITLLMESAAAKDLSCLVTGYCRLFVDPAQSVLSWSSPAKTYRISTEEGYVSRRSSDPEDFPGVDHSTSALVDLHFSIDTARVAQERVGEKEENKEEGQKEEEIQQEQPVAAAATSEECVNAECVDKGGDATEDELSELSNWCPTDSRTDANSLDNLDEDDLVLLNPDVHHPYLLVTSEKQELTDSGSVPCPDAVSTSNDDFLCYAELSRMADSLPSPTEATDEEEEHQGPRLPPHRDCILTLDEMNMQCPTDSRPPSDWACDLPGEPHWAQSEEYTPSQDLVSAPILQPSPSFVDSSSDDEFFDANDRLTPPTALEEFTESCMDACSMTRTLNLHNLSEVDLQRAMDLELEVDKEDGAQQASLSLVKKLRKRRSFVESVYTSQVSFPTRGREAEDQVPCADRELLNLLPVLRSEDEKPIEHPNPALAKLSHPTGSHGNMISEEPLKDATLSSELMEMEPDTMEFKPVNHLLSGASRFIAAVQNHIVPGDRKCSSPDSGVRRKGLDCTGASVVLKEPVLGSKKQELNNGTNGKRDEGSSPELDSSPPVHATIPPCSSGNNSPSSEEAKEAESYDGDSEAESLSMTADQRDGSCLALVNKKGISHSCESLLLTGAEDLAFSGTTAEAGDGAAQEQTATGSRSRSSELAGRLSNSTLRAKIRKLPCCLSRSQETLSTLGSSSSADDQSPSQRISETSPVTTEVGDVTEAVAEDAEEACESAGGIVELVSEEPGEDQKLLREVNEVTSISRVKGTLMPDASPTVSSMDKLLEACKDPDRLRSPGSVEPGGQSVEEIEGTQAPKGVYEGLKHCESQQPQPLPHPCSQGKACFLSPPALQVNRTPGETCGCRTTYSNCFSGELDRAALDEELTLHEFSCRAQGLQGMGLIATTPSSFPVSSISFSSRAPLPRSSFSELSPLLSPLEPSDSLPPESLQEVLGELRSRRYALPGGFAHLQRDLADLLVILQGEPRSRSRHHWETCVAHLSENKHVLHAEARKLMSDCQRVIRVGQSPEEMLQSLSQSFRTLVQLASVCMCFSSCSHCEGSLGNVLGSLRDIAKAYGDFSQAAELACGRKSCHDLSIKVLARQCTALTSSVFCLTQLYCTLAAL
ncbi:FERM and PDZ domain-containing protein 1-like isoform X1 [Scleropages formosus]|uniref:FERM and PDZ domain-containing protein 1-like isoform X1 n=1 Tax=Scleropages formosus TaxID=113540 RepID=UPI0010FAC8D4|nr:FERM and PDZ domain-containing protein 1-like isoform X1 [Scleropages formosus]XP_029108191.1 FERM and PDZ domain-containing protein 1-like isoform X1 [Scleropages formosus]XP_029108192.1 FERM and PDZ domain-containing protein 1-like isoform X1 [Scleropages formosus]